MFNDARELVTVVGCMGSAPGQFLEPYSIYYRCAWKPAPSEACSVRSLLRQVLRLPQAAAGCRRQPVLFVFVLCLRLPGSVNH